MYMHLHRAVVCNAYYTHDIVGVCMPTQVQAKKLIIFNFKSKKNFTLSMTLLNLEPFRTKYLLVLIDV